MVDRQSPDIRFVNFKCSTVLKAVWRVELNGKSGDELVKWKRFPKPSKILNLILLTDHTEKCHSHKQNVILLVTRSLLLERKY